MKRESWVISAFEEKIAVRFPRAACQPFSRCFSLPMSSKETSPERGRAPQEDIASHISRGPRLSLISLQSTVPSHKYAKKLHPFFTPGVSVTPAMSRITRITPLPCSGTTRTRALPPMSRSNEACLFITLALMDFKSHNYQGCFNPYLLWKERFLYSNQNSPALSYTSVIVKCLLD